MQSLKKLSLLLTVGAVLSLLAGCGPASQATPPEAPAKPLSQAEESLLKELEALPQDKRAGFAMRHMEDITRYSVGNKTFGERMNAAVGVPPKTASK